MSSHLEGKDRFDSLRELADSAWRDWDHKARYQWRLSFSIWGALLAATSLAVTSKIAISYSIGIFIGVATLIIHLYFMNWIEGRIREFRRQMYTYLVIMEDFVEAPSNLITMHKEKISKETACSKKLYRLFAWFQKPAALVQLLITSLLILIFCLILKVNIENLNAVQ